MTHYDTAAIRSLARRIESAESTLSQAKQNAYSQIKSANGELCGDTANAINETVEGLNREVQSISSGLKKCAEFLYHYARDLDIADEKSRTLIQSK